MALLAVVVMAVVSGVAGALCLDGKKAKTSTGMKCLEPLCVSVQFASKSMFLM